MMEPQPLAQPKPIAATTATDAGMSPQQAEQLARLIETARGVHRRYQFFNWTQTHLRVLLPHVCLVCGGYQRAGRRLAFDAFQTVVLSQPVMHSLSSADSPLMQALGAAWVEGRGRPLLLGLQHFIGNSGSASAAAELQRELADIRLLVHGVARPFRPAEIESLFVLIMPAGAPGAVHALQLMDWVLPYLHHVWLHVQATESSAEPEQFRMRTLSPRSPGSADTGSITGRERQVLAWVREGKSNVQIGEGLGISALTVKNHLQKILRKLGASNRAQAVAMAMQARLLDGPAPDRSEDPR